MIKPTQGGDGFRLMIIMNKIKKIRSTTILALRKDGKAVMAGDEIGVFDDKDFLVGICEITAEGQYGVIHVYGDDPETEEPDGANTDSMLTFKVWLADSKTEIEVTEDMMSTQILGSFGESSIPPQWTADLEKYVLNINIDTSQQHALGQQGDTGGGCFISCLRNFKYP